MIYWWSYKETWHYLIVTVEMYSYMCKNRISEALDYERLPTRMKFLGILLGQEKMGIGVHYNERIISGSLGYHWLC